MSRRTEEIDEAVIRDPADAAAAAKCWLHRRMGRLGAIAPHHPEPCAWCEFDPDYLVGKIAEFNTWAGFDNIDRFDVGDPFVRPIRSDVENFMQLPVDEQAHLVRVAQGYETPVVILDEPERPADLYR
jgi:hypothetical protein